MSLNIFVGDEIFFKDNSIKECLNSINDEIDLYTIDIDEKRKIDSNLMDMYSHLMSYDFENKYKVGLIRTTSLSKAISCIEYFSNTDLEHCLLVIDFLTDTDKQISDFKKKSIVKEVSKKSTIKYFTSLKTYEEYKLIPFVEEKLKEANIIFTSKEDFIKSVYYIVKNSKLSYSNSYREIEKLKCLKGYTFDYKKIVSIVSDNLCTDRFYILDNILGASEETDILSILKLYIPKFDKKSLESLILDLSNLTKDYIVYKNTKTCMQNINYHKFKKLKFAILNPQDFLIKLNNLLKEARKGNPATSDYIFLYFFEHIDFSC